MKRSTIRLTPGSRLVWFALVFGCFSFCATFSARTQAALVITPTFTANFNTNFGANAAAAQATWIAAANLMSSNFNDNIHVNITVDGVAGTGVFGQSSTFLNSFSYATLRNAVVADAKTADDATAVGAGGSVTAADPATANPHTWWVSTAEAKALKLIADNLNNDGTTTFGAGNPFFFSTTGATPPAGTYDFRGVALHEITEVMGRLGLSGGTIGANPNSYSLIDNFAYLAPAPGVKTLGSGAGVNFSIDNGTTLLKVWNNSVQDGLDTRDWAPPGAGQNGDGTPDSFNQFSNSGVVNGLTDVDKRLMDVIGYDRVVPEPSTIALGLLGLVGLVGYARRRVTC